MEPPLIEGGTAWVGTARQVRTRLEVHHVVKRAHSDSDFNRDRLVALCPYAMHKRMRPTSGAAW